jgi:predicted amidophosphoribosyltransferase
MPAAHESEQRGERRPTPEELDAVYEIDQRLVTPPRGEIAIVDDVLTTGLHFQAVKARLQRTFLGVRVIGLFIARRAPETTDIEDLPAEGG